ncbi:PREDICTED: uncharacterized protein LOC105565534 [Vollenhovia emeryi]|uniref:uncharacterized protein LOC105565534 n=1 Tax=Vollenhovia emeryi TaxID=411798 RepID=UPI0005F4D4B0|nr:PREDICTED: uncharacterized protein LOC105565534 [Vollenhovia emeryi]
MKLAVALLMAVAVVLSTAEEQEPKDDYIHLPGKTCEEAPACPDNRPCVMAKPHCKVGPCPDLVPTCGPEPKL